MSTECSSQARQVPAWRERTSGTIGEVRIDVDEQAGQGSDVLMVVPDDRGERLGGAATEEAEVTTLDLPSVDVVMPDRAKEHPFHGA